MLPGEQSKIVGGERAPNHYPYQISLQIKPPFYLAFLITTSPDGWAHNCGGSIVTQKHVVTAAHCIKGYDNDALSIWAGSEKLNSGGSRYMVDSTIIHPDYVELNTSDISVITIKDMFKYGPKVHFLIIVFFRRHLPFLLYLFLKKTIIIFTRASIFVFRQILIVLKSSC